MTIKINLNVIFIFPSLLLIKTPLKDKLWENKGVWRLDFWEHCKWIRGAKLRWC